MEEEVALYAPMTLEYGVIEQQGRHRAYGAGLLSSYGELESFRDARIRPLDLKGMATTEYDITDYQHELFAGRSNTGTSSSASSC